MNELVAIVGPTGVGKTSLSIDLAVKFNGEIVSADSRQVYRYMDIGTAKPTPEQRALVPHHLIDIVDPDGEFSLARYQQLANSAINDIQSRGRLPFLVGGSGLYVWAVLEGWVVPKVPPDTGFRRSLEQRAEAGEAARLHRELLRADPASAERIDPRNVRRVIRALEVSRRGTPPGNKKSPPSFESLIIGLTMPRDELYRRVDTRVDEMIAGGFIDEVKRLIGMGYGLSLPSMSSIGYREIGQYLSGKARLEEAVNRMKMGTHRFVRHQYAWFKLTDARIRWFEASEPDVATLSSLIADFSGRNGTSDPGGQMTVRPTQATDLPELMDMWNNGDVMKWGGYPDGLGVDEKEM
jgi:tRNA dimethylallyltransferase